LLIVITGAYQTTEGIDGVALTSRAFASVIWWFPYVLSVAVLMFAISTMISWAYYGSIA
jgi:AGCS family alanine or glycine:cation symporter